MKNIITFFVIALFIGSTTTTNGQTQILIEDFEDGTVEYTTSVAEFEDGGCDYFIRSDNINCGITIGNNQGNYFFGGQDLDGEGASLPIYMNFNNINISNYISLELRVYLAEDDDGSSQDWDSPDYVHFNYQVDNGGYQDLLWIESELSTGTNGSPLIDTDYDGVGDGTEITDNFVQFTANIPTTGSSLDLQIEFNLNAGDEDIAIDNVEIYGVQSGSNNCNLTTSGLTNITCFDNSTSNDATDDYIEFDLNPSGNNIGMNGYDVTTSTTGVTLSPTSGTYGSSTTFSTQNSSGWKAGDGDISITITDSDSMGCTLMETVIDPGACSTPDVVINEILADPDSDVNNDGIYNFADDEFIEIYNNSGTTVDLTNWVIEDAVQVRHTFPSTSLQPNEGIVIFGGGTPSGFEAQTQTASTGQLGFNNGGDDITLKDDNEIIVDNYSYSSSTNDISDARNPDFTGSFVDHDQILSNPVNYSPGESNEEGQILPVDWLSFTASTLHNKEVQLHWATANEFNNSHFVVERSTDVRKWQDIGKVQAAEENQSIYKYQFVDKSPTVGMNYYRLRQVDVDGYTDHSKIQKVRFGKKSNTSIALYPNPASSILNIRDFLSLGNNLQINILDINGRKVMELDQPKPQIPVTHLQNGIYILTITNEHGSQQFRFVKE